MNFFEKIVEWIFAIGIALSPTIPAALVGAYFYFTAENMTGQAVGIAIAVAGLIAGIFLVVRIKKKTSATEFSSRIIATPELDKKKEEK